MTDPADLLAAYDAQLRVDAEAVGATSVTTHGPLLLVTLPGGHGFISYRDLDGCDAAAIRSLVTSALAHYREDPDVDEVEWKTRGHDHAPGLHEALVDAGFVPQEPESIMLGEAAALAVDVALPPGVTLRRVSEEADVRAMCAMQAVAFGDDDSDDMAEVLLGRLGDDDGMELWVAEADGSIISAGRLDPVPGSEFAGIWGGATLVAWRGRGIYRALTAARARSALALGKKYLHSDSTEYSRPILERSGMVKVSTTTPYEWRREA
jgi:hypothetical protein